MAKRQSALAGVTGELKAKRTAVLDHVAWIHDSFSKGKSHAAKRVSTQFKNKSMRSM